MRFEYTPTPQEYFQAAATARHLDTRQRTGALWHWLGYGATSLGLLCLLERPGGGGWFAPATLILLGGLILYGVYRSPNVSRWTRTNQRFIGPVVFEFTLESILLKTDPCQYTFSWRYYQRWVGTKHLFLLYAAPSRYQFTPKRVFTSESQMQEFRLLLNEKIVPPSTAFPVQLIESIR